MLCPLVALTTGASELVLVDLDSSIANLRISSKQKSLGKRPTSRLTNDKNRCGFKAVHGSLG